MSKIISLPTFSDSRGSLTIIEQFSEFEIKRIYYIYDVDGSRGGHRHKKTTQGLICLSGRCQVYINNGESEKIVELDSPEKCLILEPEDWHTMDNFTESSVLLVLASEYYDREDYIDEPYDN